MTFPVSWSSPSDSIETPTLRPHSVGLRDSNTARRNVTERYLLHCNEIFAICNIGRATTDVGVEEVIRLARQAQLSKVGIVCTKSDVSIKVYILNSRSNLTGKNRTYEPKKL